MAHSPTIHQLLETLEFIFKTCDLFNLKLSTDKCELYSTSVKFCGQILSKDGISQDPERISALVNMKPPTNVSELQQYLCAINWIQSSIVDYARISKPLTDWLQQLSEGTSRKGQVLKKLSLEMNKERLQQF